MNSPALPRLSAEPFVGNDVRCAGLTSALVLAAAALLAPLAYWQLGSVGLAVLGAAALTMVIAVLLSHRAVRYFAGSGRAIAGMLSAMSARMFVPLLFVVAIVVCSAPSVPAWSAMYIAPLYFVMLIAETVFALRRCHAGQSAPPGRTGQLPQVASNEG